MLHYLFDVFSKHTPYVKKKAMVDFCDIFNLPKNTFGAAQKLTCDAFQTALEGKSLNFSALRQAKPMITAMVGLRPGSVKEEKAAILAALNGNPHLDNYIYECLPNEKEFFIVSKAFWDGWCLAVNWEEDDDFGLKMDRQLTIKNSELMEAFHQFRMKDLVYKQDYVLLPKFVFFPLSKWYPCDKIITRHVIKSSNVRRRDDQSMMSSHYSQRFMMSNQKFFNNKENDFDEDLIHRDGDYVFELELNPKIVYLGKISDKGEKLHKNAI